MSEGWYWFNLWPLKVLAKNGANTNHLNKKITSSKIESLCKNVCAHRHHSVLVILSFIHIFLFKITAGWVWLPIIITSGRESDNVEGRCEQDWTEHEHFCVSWVWLIDFHQWWLLNYTYNNSHDPTPLIYRPLVAETAYCELMYQYSDKLIFYF